MNLDAIDHRILGVLEYAPETAARNLARDLRIKAATANYRVVRMISGGVLRKGGLVNYARLGLTNIVTYFSLRSLPEATFNLLQNGIKQDPRVAWFGSLAGDFQYGLALMVKDVEEANEFLYEYVDRFKLHISQKTVVPRTVLTCFARGYLSRTKGAKERFVVQASASPSTSPISEKPLALDDLDWKILSAICNQNWNSLRDISRILGGSAATIERRIKRLTNELGLLKCVYYINPEALEMNSYRLLLSSARLCTSLRKLIYQFCEDTPQVIRLFESLGAWDFEIDLEAKNPIEVRDILQQLDKATDSQISNTRILSEIEDYKLSFLPSPM